MAIPIPGGFADVPDSMFEPIPAGVYNASVFGGEMKTSGPEAKYPGSEYIAWEFAILDEPYEKRRVWLNTSLVESARPMLKSFLLAVGYTPDELNDSNFGFDIEDVIGRRVRVQVTKGTNPKTGEENNNVRRVLPVDETESVLP